MRAINSRRIFVDSGAWLAVYWPKDAHHTRASAWFEGNTELLFTTDYAVDETLTLFVKSKRPDLGRTFGTRVFGGIAAVHHVTEEDVKAAWDVFRRYSSDKEWSFTDCTSKVVMTRFQITRAFSFDHHFHQFGEIQVIP